jgi:hypothetical protein
MGTNLNLDNGEILFGLIGLTLELHEWDTKKQSVGMTLKALSRFLKKKIA